MTGEGDACNNLTFESVHFDRHVYMHLSRLPSLLSKLQIQARKINSIKETHGYDEEAANAWRLCIASRVRATKIVSRKFTKLPLPSRISIACRVRTCDPYAERDLSKTAFILKFPGQTRMPVRHHLEELPQENAVETTSSIPGQIPAPFDNHYGLSYL